MRFTTVSLVSFLLLSAGLSAGIATQAAAQNFDVLPKPLPMPAFKLPKLDGSSGTDADLRNTVTIIRFWASW